jgi:hypothetical protein
MGSGRRIQNMSRGMSLNEQSAGGAPEGVAAWRQARLLEAGFDRQVALEFAHDRAVDLHQLLELVDRGCPPHLAARILAPLDYRGELR